MGYRDDFYNGDNLIGYTGDLNNNPTVYFLSNDQQFGHITQYHQYHINIGRERVHQHTLYRMENLLLPGKPGVRLVEYLQMSTNQSIPHPTQNVPITVIHPSRNILIWDITQGHRLILENAIKRFPLLKMRYTMLGTRHAMMGMHRTP
jgi:hypothetical protein